MSKQTTRGFLGLVSSEGSFRERGRVQGVELVVNGRSFPVSDLGSAVDRAHELAKESAETITVFDEQGRPARHWSAGHRYF